MVDFLQLHRTHLDSSRKTTAEKTLSESTAACSICSVHTEKRHTHCVSACRGQILQYSRARVECKSAAVCATRWYDVYAHQCVPLLPPHHARRSARAPKSQVPRARAEKRELQAHQRNYSYNHIQFWYSPLRNSILKPGSPQHETETWRGFSNSVVVRSSCKLRLHEIPLENTVEFA